MRFYRIMFNDASGTRQAWATSRTAVKTLRDEFRREIGWKLTFRVDKFDVDKNKRAISDFLNEYARYR
jgi:hypothetical protein